jgi:phosphoribosylanthranilate isomerase
VSVPPVIKICGLTRAADAGAAEAAGATYGGVIFARGRRTVSAVTAAEVLHGSALTRVGVFVDAPPAELLQIATVAGLRILQLHGDENPGYIAQIRQAWGGEIWKALHPRGAEEFLAGLDLYGSCVDGLLLDGWSPVERGGTGARFPWEEVARVRDTVPTTLSFGIAGGLTPDNVATAVRLLRPDLVDVSSGVEVAPGIKDPAAVERFVAAVRSVASEMQNSSR